MAIYTCNQCNFEASNESCLTAHMQAEHETGIIKTAVGFMMVPQNEENVVPEDDITKEPEKKKKRKSHKEFLKEDIKDKTNQRTKKSNVNSFKTKFLTIKKKAAALQPEQFCFVYTKIMLESIFWGLNHSV